MPVDFIGVNTQKPFGAKLVRLANNLLEVRELTDALADARGHMTTGTDFAKFAEYFGIDPTQASQASQLLDWIDDILNTNTEITGADRRDRLNQFCSRIAGQ